MDYNALEEIRAIIAAADEARLRERLYSMRAADLADVAERLDSGERDAIFRLLDDDTAGAVLEEMDETAAAAVIRELPAERASRILGDMAPDEAADVLQDLPDEAASALLAGMDADEAEDVRELLEYPENTAGGRMSTDFVSISPIATVAQVIDELRANPPDPETAYYLYVCERKGRLIGVVSLRDLVVASPEERIADIMARDVIRLSATADQEEAAEMVARYNLLALPIIDDQDRMVGVITVDDVLEVLEEEATEDILHLSSGVEPPADEATLSLRTRLRRTAATLAAGFVAAVLMAEYREEFYIRLPYLLFIPLALSVSEVVTGQVMAAVGGVLRRDVPKARLGRVVAREFLITAIIAAAAGGLIALLLGQWQRLERTGATLGIAVLVVAAVASVVGGLLPAVSRMLHRDPSAISVSLAAAVSDTAALAFYLWVVVVLG